MATHDYVIDNSTGANVRSDINNVLQAILTNNSSSSAPSTTAAYMWWADTTTGILKIRNSANDGWVELLQLDGTLTLEDGSVSAPALAFRDDLNTGIYSSVADTINFVTGGVERQMMNTTNTVFNEDGANVDFRIEGDTEPNLFFVDAGNERIGINTSSPTVKLHQHESSSAANYHVFTNSTTGSSSGDGGIVGIDANEDLILWNQENENVRFGSNNTERMRVHADGQVTIGNDHTGGATLSGQLTVNTTSGCAIVVGDTGSGEYFRAGGESGQVRLGSQSNHPLRFFTNGTSNERMQITAAGQVMIGVSTVHPVAGNNPQFLISGTNFATALHCQQRFENDVAGATLILSHSRNGTQNSHTILQSGDEFGKIRFYGSDGNDFNNYGAEISAEVDGTPGSDDMPGRLLFKTTADGSASSSERMRITGDGKVGIGTTSPSCTGLNVSVNTTTTSRVSENTVQIQNSNNGASTCAGIVLACSNGPNTEFNIVTQKHGSGSGADFFLDNGTKARMEMSGDHGDIKFGVNGTMIGTFTPGLSNTTVGLGIEPRNGSIFLSRSNGAALYVNVNTDGSQLATFRRNGNEQGKIIAHSSSVSYETTSDYRLKENAVAISDGITRLKQLKPYKFNFKSNSSVILDGFFAHEAQAVVPECASGTKDEVVVQAQVDSEVYKESELGKPIYQGIDQSKLVPLLVAAVQELITKVETLEAA